MKPELIRLTIQVTAEQRAALEQRSQRQRIPISVLVRQVLREQGFGEPPQ